MRISSIVITIALGIVIFGISIAIMVNSMSPEFHKYKVKDKFILKDQCYLAVTKEPGDAVDTLEVDKEIYVNVEKGNLVFTVERGPKIEAFYSEIEAQNHLKEIQSKQTKTAKIAPEQSMSDKTAYIVFALLILAMVGFEVKNRYFE